MKKMNYPFSMPSEVAGVSVAQVKKWFRHQLSDLLQRLNRRRPSWRSATDPARVETSEPAVCTPADRSKMQPCSLLVYQMQHFMESKYELRYNVLKCEVEYRMRQGGGEPAFRALTERDLNSMILRAQEHGLAVWDRDVKRYVHSDRVKEYNPVDAYLDRLPVWDGKERICALADLIPTSDAAWRNRFRVWFLSMVAHWRGMDDSHGNCTLPLLSGAQGCGKSTWCLNLLPPELREFYTDSIDFSQRGEAARYLNRFLLINIDEFDTVGASHQGFLKHILQKPSVNLRRPHQQAIRQMKRYASFVGTCNHLDLLSDSSGSRRFLCTEVTGQIRRDRAIDYPQLYAEALHALAAGERYWFTREEEAEISSGNRSFQQLPPAEQLFLRYFRPATEGEANAEKLSAVEILQRIRQRSSVQLPFTTLTLFGRLLQRNNVTKIHTAKGNLYCVAEVCLTTRC